MATISDAIVEFLKKIDRPIGPLEIATNIERNYNSVRSTLSKLYKSGRINKDFYGHYSIGRGYESTGYGEELPRIQNLGVRSIGRVGVRGVDSGRVWVYEPNPEIVGGLRVELRFGFQNKKLSWTVRSPEGMDFWGLRLVRSLVEGEVERCGYVVPEWEAHSHELLKDHMGLKIEGATVVTLNGLEGTLEKIYNKVYGVRRELRVNRPVALNQLEAFWQGGLQYSQVVQMVGVMSNKISEFVESSKGQNRLLATMNSQIKALFETNIRLTETINKLLEKKG